MEGIFMGLIFSMDDALMMEIVFYFILLFNIIIILFVVSSKIKYDIKYLVFGNLVFFLQHLFVLLTINTRFSFAFFVNMSDVVASLFYMIGLLQIFKVKIPLKKIIGLLLFTAIALLVIDQVNSLHSLLRLATNIATAAIYIYGFFMVIKKKTKQEMLNSRFLLLILIYAIILKTTIVIFRIYSSTYEVSIDSIQSSVVVFTFLSLMLAISINIATLFSQYDKIYLELKKSSSTDYLTGVYNRKFMYDKISELKSLHLREKINFGVILIDINGFKKINDTFGHLEGDRILKTFAKKLRENIRDIDYIGRYGGDEFLLVAIIEDKESFLELHQRIIDNIEKIKTKDNQPITISGGAYLINDQKNFDSIDEIIQYVDTLLYNAKKNKNNQINY